MKNYLLLFVSICLAGTCFGQGSSTKVITLTCLDGKSIAAEDITAKAMDKITFEIKELSCCDSADLVITVKTGADSRAIPWNNPGNRRSFTMGKVNAEIMFSCGNIKGQSLVSLDNPIVTENIVWGNTLQAAIQLSDLWKKMDGPDSTKAKDNAVKLLTSYGFSTSDFSQIRHLDDYGRLSDLQLSNQQESAIPTGTGGNSSVQKSETGTTSNITGIFNPTLVIDALGKFAAKRFKEELTIAFLQKFRDSLMSEQYRELRLLFPRTFHTLASADVFNFAQFYQSLHENAQTDLYNLPENMANVVRENQSRIDSNTYQAILGSLDLVRVIEQRMPAAAAIEFLAYRDYVDLSQPTVYSSTIRMLGLFSKHLHNWGEASPTGWASEAQLLRLVTDKDAFNFWMALLLKQEQQDLSAIQFAGNTLYTILNQNLAAHNSYLRELVSRFGEVQSSAQQLLALSDKDSLGKRELFFQYSIATLNVLTTAVNLAKVVDRSTDKTSYDRLTQILKAGHSLANFAHRKRFGDAISVALEIIKLIYPSDTLIGENRQDQTTADNQEIVALAKRAKCQAKKTLKRAKKTKDTALIEEANQVKSQAESALKIAKNKLKDKTPSIADTKAALQANNQLLKPGADTLWLRQVRTNQLLSRLDKYGNLLVSCANADNSDELLAVLERVAAPVQSYRKKRGAGHFSAAINLYPGLAFGQEYNLMDSTDSDKGPVVAFTTPVGLSLDWGFGKNQSISAFFSLIDIGAVTAFRLNDPDAELLPELKWKNVFAPGGYIMWGIGRTPLTLGVGGQYGPALRKIQKDDGTADIQASHFRFGITLTVDVPLFIVSLGSSRK